MTEIDSSKVSPYADIELYKTLIDPQPPTIQEHDFIKYFLPMFASKDKNVPVSEWLHISGNAHMPVNVMKGNEFLFQVPALLGDVAVISVMGGAEHSMLEIVLTAQKLNDLGPRHGEEFLKERLGNRIIDGAPDVVKAKQWNVIFERYGLEKIPIENEQPTEGQSTNVKPGSPPIVGVEDF